MNRIIVSILFAVSLSFNAYSQNTVGLLSYDFSEQYDGYNIMFPHNQADVYLLNNCGEIVHTWEDDAMFRPGNTAILMANGNLVKAKRNASITGDAIWAGGGGGIVEIRSWDNDLIWNFELNDSLERLHHDIAVMPNGNILMLVWEKKNYTETIAAGRDSALISENELWPDYIIEVEPIGQDSFNIAWEWHVWDHLIQDYDSTKDNFGVVAEHDELVDINFAPDGSADWMHTNSIDYNAFLDQIIISVPKMNEIWILDHSTTTEQAAGHFGGLSGRGGDLIFRWGNDQAFDQGTDDDQQLFYQHDAHWIDEFLPGSHPHYGKIAVFNNRLGNGTYSAVNIIEPTYDMYKGQYIKTGNTYSPNDFTWTYVHPDTAKMFSSGLSNVQFLTNGNTLINSGRNGYSFEINPNEEIIWEFKTPLKGGNPATQGDTLVINDNLTFRFNRLPMDFAAFEGRDLSPKGFIELEPNTTFCDISSSSEDLMEVSSTYIYPNPTSGQLTIEWSTGGEGQIDIFDVQGRRIHRETSFGGRIFVNVSNYTAGLYFVHINGIATGKFIKSN